MKRRKIVSLALVGSVALTGLVGCGPREVEKEPINENATQLEVATFNGALGDEWLYALKARFEKAYENVSFETGKMGVQVSIDTDKKYAGGSLVSTITSDDADVYFTEEVNYYDFVLGAQGNSYLKDISEIVTGNIPGEEKSIEDKMNSTAASYFKTNGKYYAIPFYESYSGITYDIDLFQSKGFYLKGDAANGYEALKLGGAYQFVGEGQFVDGKTTQILSYGPDGEYGTSDDGLPATYTEFFAMMDYMKGKEVIPFVWSGNFPGYFSSFLTAMWADHEGETGVINSITLDGVTEELVDLSTGTPYFYTQENITTENGYLMAKQEGKYYALQFADKILSSSEYYYSLSTNESFTHTQAQDEFIASVPSPNKKPIAMLIEGTFWFNEASSSFASYAKKYGSQYGENRNLGFMPLPKATNSDFGDASFLSIKNTACMVNALTDVPMDALKAFIQFAHTDYSLSEFTSLVNLPRGFSYEMDSEHTMTAFAKSVYDLHAKSEIIFPYSSSEIFRKNVNVFHMETGIWNSKIDTNYIYPLNAMKAGSDKTPEDYFSGLSTYLESAWTTLR